MPGKVAKPTMEKEARKLFYPKTQKVLLKNETLAVGDERRILPKLDVSRWDRLHFMFYNGEGKSIAGLKVKILFAMPLEGVHCGAMLADSTVWFEDTIWDREFVYEAPDNFNRTGFAMSVPVVAPQLFDVIIRNVGDAELENICVGMMAQEI